MKKFNALKNKKGFTLIELVVVLIILAIMAAFAIPSMIGFVDQAREDALYADARVGLIAAQIIATREGLDGGAVDTDFTTNTEFQGYVAECPGQHAAFSNIEVDATSRVISITYTVSGVGSVTLAP